MLVLTPDPSADTTKPAWVETQNTGRVTNLWLFVLLLLNKNCNLSLPIHHTLLQFLYHLWIRQQYIHLRLQV